MSKPKWKVCKKCGAGVWTVYTGKYVCNQCQKTIKERKKPFRLNEIQRVNIELEIKLQTAIIEAIKQF